MHKVSNFPKFKAKVYPDDSIRWSSEGFNFCATLVPDLWAHPFDGAHYDCLDFRRWEDGEWFFAGLIVSVSIDGVKLSGYAASRFGLPCNYSATSNEDLSLVAQDLEAEALEVARVKARELHNQLSKVIGE